LSGLAAARGETADSEIDTSVYDLHEKRFGSYDNKKDFKFVCINNNDNVVISPTPPPNPPTPPCEVTVDTITGILFNPGAIAYDSANERMYVGSLSGTFPTNPFNSTVSVIDTNTNTVIDTIPVGEGASDIAYDPVNHRMYVVNAADNTVSVINLCPRPQQLQQQSTNDIITTTADNNDDIILKSVFQQKEQKQIEEKQKIQTNNIIQPKDITTKDTTIKNVIDQKEQQKLAEEQKIQKSNVMSPPSLP
jgi:YVTN family beta-propeller protein